MQSISFQFEFLNEEDLKFKPIIANVFENFNYFLDYNNFKFTEVKIIIGNQASAHFKLSSIFKKNIEFLNFEHQFWFDTEALIIENNRIDYIGTCFYMINCCQEYTLNSNDFLGRFDFKRSYQYKFNCIEKNLVLGYFQEMAEIIFGHKILLQKSQYHLSHDIDFVNSAWKKELKNAIKSLDLKILYTLIIKKIRGGDSWQNIEEILTIERFYNIKSTFFWLTKKGKTPFKNVRNADYNLHDNYIKKCIQLIEKSPLHTNGLHKSISNININKELERFPSSITKNRYHFLKFNIQKDFDELEKSKIEEDYSLGFSNAIGFRNSYGLPFKPFDPIKKIQYTFQIYPLHIMDSSLYYYMNLKSTDRIISKVKSFIIQNSSSCVLSILWHNNFFESDSYHKLLLTITEYCRNEK